MSETERIFPTGSSVTRDRLRSECGADRFASLAPWRESETEKISSGSTLAVSASSPEGSPPGSSVARHLLPERVVVPTASLRSLLIECQRQRRFPYASVSDRHSLQEGIASGIVGVSILSPNGSPLGRNVSYMKLRVCSAERAEASSGGKPRRTRRLWRPSSISAWRAATAA